MKEIFNQRYKRVSQLADQQGEAFAEIVSESFDDLDSLGEFVDTLFYMHSITIDCHIVMEQRPSIFYSCFLTSFLTEVLNQVGGDFSCPAM